MTDNARERGATPLRRADMSQRAIMSIYTSELHYAVCPAKGDIRCNFRVTDLTSSYRTCEMWGSYDFIWYMTYFRRLRDFTMLVWRASFSSHLHGAAFQRVIVSYLAFYALLHMYCAKESRLDEINNARRQKLAIWITKHLVPA